MTEYYEKCHDLNDLPNEIPVGATSIGGNRVVSAYRLNRSVSHPRYVGGKFENGFDSELDLGSVGWRTVPRQPAPTFQPEIGQTYEGEAVEISLKTRRGIFERIDEEGHARLRQGFIAWQVHRESLRPVAQPAVKSVSCCDKCTRQAVARGLCGECLPVEGMAEKAALAAIPADPYRAHRLACQVEGDVIGAPEATSRLSQGIAAARAQSAREAMNGPMVRRKRVEWIQPGQPASWPSADENEP